MLAGCQPKLDALRALDKQTFEVPPHVLLIKDFALEHQVSEEEEKAKAAELEKLKLRYRQVTDATTLQLIPYHLTFLFVYKEYGNARRVERGTGEFPEH